MREEDISAPSKDIVIAANCCIIHIARYLGATATMNGERFNVTVAFIQRIMFLDITRIDSFIPIVIFNAIVSNKCAGADNSCDISLASHINR